MLNLIEIQPATMTGDEAFNYIKDNSDFNLLELAYIKEVVSWWDETQNYGEGGEFFHTIHVWSTDSDQTLAIGSKILLGELKLPLAQ